MAGGLVAESDLKRVHDGAVCGRALSSAQTRGSARRQWSGRGCAVIGVHEDVGGSSVFGIDPDPGAPRNSKAVPIGPRWKDDSVLCERLQASILFLSRDGRHYCWSIWSIRAKRRRRGMTEHRQPHDGRRISQTGGPRPPPARSSSIAKRQAKGQLVPYQRPEKWRRFGPEPAGDHVH